LNSGKSNLHIAVVAPSSPANNLVDIEGGVTFLRENWSAKVSFTSKIKLSEGYLAGKDNIRAKDFISAIAKSGIDGIIALRGGYGAMRILSILETSFLSNKLSPKFIVGFSDFTALLFLLSKNKALKCIHGPNLLSLSSTTNNPINAELLHKVIDGTISSYSLRDSYGLPKTAITVISSGNVSAPIIGGNLSILTALLGTPYFPDLTGKILFFEDTGEAIYRLDRMITQLLLSGKLYKVAGIAIGTFKGVDQVKVISLLKERLSILKIPIICNLPIGHDADNAPIPFLAKATISSTSKDLIVY
jgi:muramoyltetrapeptide carboxypeptidase